jgi:hypothetical protein
MAAGGGDHGDMAEGTLPRTGLTTFGTDQDQHPNRVKYNAELQKLEDKVALFTQGLTAARPASGKRGTFFWDETQGKLQYDTGTAWADLINVGGGGVGRDVTPAVAGTEGVSTKGARADHTHNLPLATPSAHGAMSSTDKAKLDGAASGSGAGLLVIRDSGGRAQFVAPIAGADAANKSYVDSMVWDGSKITTGTVSAERLPLATGTANGIMTSADKTKLDNAVAAPTVSRLVIRDAFGRAQFADPAAAQDAATKAYVDTKVNTAASAGHTHAGTDITSVIPAAMIPLATATTNGAMMASDRNLIDAASPQAYPNSLVKTDANGRFQAAAPAVPADVATRGYVDDAAGARAMAVHTHAGTDLTSAVPANLLPLATSTTSGAMINTDKVKLDGSSYTPAANSLVLRDGNGRAQFADPVNTAEAATKGYVDTGLGGKSNTGHTHDAASITTGVMNNARLPWATRTSSGIMSYQDKALLDDREVGAWANTLVVRDSGGRFDSQRPVSANNVATKDFCDDNTNSRISIAEFDKRITRGASYTYLRSPDGGTAFACNDSGTVGSSVIYNTNAAVGAYRAVWVTSSGILGYNLSSRRFKTAEYDYEVPLELLDEVHPKRFKYISDVDEMGLDQAPERVNFIAEDLHDAGLTEYVSYDDEGLPQTINEQLMVNALWSFAKQQQDLIRGLTDRVKALEGE